MAAITNTEFSRPKWRLIVLATLAFWLSSSLILDVIIMPSLYSAGMLSQPGFVSAGYSIFWIFNHLEVLCGALVLTGLLVLHQMSAAVARNWQIAIAFGLLAVGLIYTYGLTPEMSAVGLQLNWFDSIAEMPAAMKQMHGEYWLLELLKIVGAGALLVTAAKQAS